MRILLIILLTVYSFKIWAQYPFPKQEFAQLTQNRVLAILLLEESSDVEKAMNQVFREAFSESWTLTPVEFFLPDEFGQLKKRKDQNYFFLTQRPQLSKDLRYGFDYVSGSLAEWVIGASSTTQPSDALKNYQMGEISLLYHDFILSVYEGKKERLLTIVTFINDQLGKHDYVFLAQQLNLLISTSNQGVMRADYVNPEDNIGRLSSLKILLLSDLFDENDREEIGKNLIADYEYRDFHSYQKAILDKEPGTAYIKLIFSFQHNKFMWCLIESATGQILSINDCSDFKFSGSYPASELVKGRQLKQALDLEIQMLNNYYNK